MDPFEETPPVNRDALAANADPHVNHAHRDPISGEPGAHPVGTGLGAAGGGAAGAAIGSLGGPIGAAIGLVAGAIAGGLAGKGVAESIDPTVEEAYWRDNFAQRDYVDHEAEFETYRSAYRTGYEGRARFPDKSFEEVESELEAHYDSHKGDSGLKWNDARHAALDAWNKAGKTADQLTPVF